MFATIQLTFANISNKLFNDVEGEGLWAKLTRLGKFVAGLALTMLAWALGMFVATAIELAGMPLLALILALAVTGATYGFLFGFIDTIFERYNENGTVKA